MFEIKKILKTFFKPIILRLDLKNVFNIFFISNITTDYLNN